LHFAFLSPSIRAGCGWEGSLCSCYIYANFCHFSLLVRPTQKHCKYEKAKLWLHYKPSLFQHIGMTSSLKGKVQKLKDRQFGKIPAFYAHKNNPLAQVRTQIMPYKIHSLNKAYLGESFFWGLLPQSGDNLEFIFNQPTVIKK
jgi:alpha-1,3-mannosylglycoprotein beta-1,4-N-acetylglucosaminyltransferase A/B